MMEPFSELQDILEQWIKSVGHDSGRLGFKSCFLQKGDLGKIDLWLKNDNKILILLA